MEITIRDLEFMKLSPTLITFLKAIVNRNDDYIQELNKVSDVKNMAEYLEERMIIKIVGTDISHISFELRCLEIIKHLNYEDNNVEKDIDEVINYFKKITNKTRISLKSGSNRRFIKGRLSTYSVQDLKEVIDLKYDQWANNPKMSQYIRIETFFNETKFQGYIGELESNKEDDLNVERV